MNQNTSAAPTAGAAPKRGVRLRTLNWILVIAAVILSVILIYISYRVNASYNAMVEAKDLNLSCRQAANDMLDASVYLTGKARDFVATLRVEYAADYFQEVDVTRRRDNALAQLNSLIETAEPAEYLSRAMDDSNKLMQREIYAMALTVLTSSRDASVFPEQLRQVEFSREDLELPSAGKRALAHNLLFGEEYEQYKDDISQSVSLCIDELQRTAEVSQNEHEQRLAHLLRQQQVLIVILLLTVVCFVFMASLLVFTPLRNFVRHIEQQEPVPIKGSRETRILAERYNALYTNVKSRQEKLSYEATHDPLTGLNNRGVFDDLCEQPIEGSAAMMILDIDDFKGINDRYGHAVGDQVLKAVAAQLHSSFRAGDYICRIGGDEFAVVMLGSVPAHRTLIETKLAQIRTNLSTPIGPVPKVSLSAGVAFGTSENTYSELFKQADDSLYIVKNGGRKDGVAFYN